MILSRRLRKTYRSENEKGVQRLFSLLSPLTRMVGRYRFLRFILKAIRRKNCMRKRQNGLNCAVNDGSNPSSLLRNLVPFIHGHIMRSIVYVARTLGADLGAIYLCFINQ